MAVVGGFTTGCWPVAGSAPLHHTASVFLRIPFGLVKGALVGAALGTGLWAIFRTGAPTFVEYLFYALVGSVAGVVCGQPPWRKGAWLASILKAVVGVGVGIGFYVLASKFFDPTIPIPLFAPGHQNLTDEYFVFAPIVGALYGLLVELDDGGQSASAKAPAPTQQAQ